MASQVFDTGECFRTIIAKQFELWFISCGTSHK